MGSATIGVIGMVAVPPAIYAVRRTPGVSRAVLFLGARRDGLHTARGRAAGRRLDRADFLGPFLHALHLYLYVSYAMLRYLFHDKVTRDEYFATAAAFTVVAWAFAYALSAVQVVWPDSFSSISGTEQSWFEILYLSFSTLTSVGLSDIVPVGLQARSLVMLEVVADPVLSTSPSSCPAWSG